MKTLEGRKTKIHKANDQRAVWADGLGAVPRSNVTHQGARQRAVLKGKQLSARRLFAPRTDAKSERQDRHPRPSSAPARAAPGSLSIRSPAPVCGHCGRGQEFLSSSGSEFSVRRGGVLTPLAEVQTEDGLNLPLQLC